MRFTKMQGCGNDYIYINCFEEKVPDPGSLAIRLSDRHFGIGSDGVILICPSDVADCRMDMYNLDGSRGRMCGNGIRCVGKYVYDHGIVHDTSITVETLSGIKRLTLIPDPADPSVISEVTVNMGAPRDAHHLTLAIPGDKRDFTYVSMGNPHAVTYVDDPFDVPLEQIGPLYEHHEVFPEQANIEFVHITDRSHIEFRVWERGSGETFACGTGACASAYSCLFNGLTDNEVDVRMRGGSVHIRYSEEEDTVYMTGPAVEVFTGDVRA